MVAREERLAEIVHGAAGLREAGSRLVEAANAAGGRDNITVVLFRIEEVASGRQSEQAEETLTGSGPTSAEMRSALAADATATHAAAPRPAGRAEDPRGDATVARRLPLSPDSRPAGRAPKRRRRSGRARALRILAFFTVFGLPVLLAAFIASQSVYFLGTNDQGFVTLYRGLPYDLPAGVSLYEQNFVSGVATRELAPPVQRTVSGHALRSRQDGADLVRQIELGRLSGQAGTP